MKHHMKILATAQPLKERAVSQQTCTEKLELRTWSGGSSVAVSWRRTWAGIEGHGSRTVDLLVFVATCQRIPKDVSTHRNLRTECKGSNSSNLRAASWGEEAERSWVVLFSQSWGVWRKLKADRRKPWLKMPRVVTTGVVELKARWRESSISKH